MSEVVASLFSYIETDSYLRNRGGTDRYYSFILQGVVTSCRRWKEIGIPDVLLNKLATHLKANCDDMLAFLTLVDDHPQRESLSALLLKNPPTPSWLLRCASLKNPLIKDCAQTPCRPIAKTPREASLVTILIDLGLIFDRFWIILG